MAESKLTPELLRERLNYDPATGEWTWRWSPSLKIKRGMPAGNVAGNGRCYIALTIDGRSERFLAHRLSWFWLHGEWPDVNVVPKNGDYLDFREGNLVLESPAETASKGHVRPTRAGSGIKGVGFDKRRGKWFAYIDRDYRRKSLGQFDTVEEARAARKAAEAAGPPTQLRLFNDAAVATADRMRDQRAWNRVITEYGITAWVNAKHFHADVGFPPSERSRVKAVRPDEVIGPDNWAWTEKPMSSREMGQAEYMRQHRAANPDIYRERDLMRDFGMTLAAYNGMFQSQKGLCAICGNPETSTWGGQQRWLAVDHNPKTHTVRALLCGGCNNGLGRFRDDPVLLRAAAAYIEKHATSPQGKIIPIDSRNRRRTD